MPQLEALHAYLQQITAAREIPGAVLYVGQGDETLLFEAYGDAQWIPAQRPMTRETYFDLASLTKVSATLPCILRLLGDGWMQLESTLGELLPEPVDPGIAKITLYDLLTHTAGLIPDHDLRGKGTHAETMAWLRMQPPARPTGEDVVYSDVGFLLLGDVIEQFMGMRLDEAVQRLVWKPLGMQQTCFCPASESGPFAATEEVNGIVKCGVVHDENAEALGGIAGHAGAFSTASDLARYLRAWLTPELLDPVWVLRSFLNYTPGLSENRGLGWVVYREADTGNLVGHAGFTGTSLWMDEVTRRYAILLANRVHPSRQNAAMPAIRRKAIDWIFDEDATR